MVRKPNILILGGENATSAPQQHLEELGCDVRTASKVAEAAGICLFTPPDLVVVTGRKAGLDDFVEQLSTKTDCPFRL